MPEFSYDDKGNWIKYEYKDENLINQLINVPNEVYEKIESMALLTLLMFISNGLNKEIERNTMPILPNI